MRLAFFTPLPPAPTGIADYSIDVLRELAAHHEIDAVHDQETVDPEALPAGVGVLRAADVEARHASRPYDLAVYQMGNGVGHQYLYPFLARFPGLLVLHDLVLHHSRARAFLDSPEARAYAAEPASVERAAAAQVRLDEYRAELEHSYPGRGERLVAAHLNTSGVLLPYAYPLFRLPVEASRLTACHNDFMAAAVSDEVPGSQAVRIPMIMEGAGVSPAVVRALRERLGIPPDAFVVGSFGLLTREKRIDTVARAVARASAFRSQLRLRLLLVGPVPDRAELDRRLEALGVRGRTIVTDRVPLLDLPAHMEAADLVAHLRFPTARETSAALLRVLAQGRPTVVSDLEHLSDIPADAVVRAAVNDEEGELTRAILRLADNADRRRQLGQRAAEHVRREHSPSRGREGYLSAIEEARRRRPPSRVRPWPAHFTAGRR
jgi:glycosyltransferase involved in cell wall biosynthesis